ncbi:MlaD family protein [Pedobacter sp. SYSU D00535]|uniref:MlaD family protein n=1 Tax=Pedobacter sp. SYSU D00535 TaxID=2810308 RepID=UPI001A962FBB|nr:MlaD family protein [Pedobacter sp. SYSU D00535]
MQVADKRHITVGIFIFIGLLIFVIGIFTLGSQKKAFGERVTVSVVFDDIEGLKTGGNVWFSGVKVGTIKKIEFHGGSQVLVSMNIQEEAQQYIHKDATATLSSDGLIGNRIVEISGGSPKAPIIQDGDRIQANRTLSTDEIMATFQENNKNLVAITGDFRQLSSNLVAGKGAAGALLSDEGMARDLKSTIANLNATTQAADRMMMDLNRFARTLNTKGGLADQLLTDTAVFARLRSSVNELQQASRSASAMAANLNAASAKLNQSDNPAGVLLNDQQSAERVKQILINLEKSSHNLNEDLKALQSNFLFRGYFKKKREQAAEQE